VLLKQQAPAADCYSSQRSPNSIERIAIRPEVSKLTDYTMVSFNTSASMVHRRLNKQVAGELSISEIA
jgi:hypothetical protein